MLSFWQSIPLHLNPVAFSIGFFTVRWYALFFVLAFFLAYSFCEKESEKAKWLSKEKVFDLAVVLFFSAIIGARLGFALFYQPLYFSENPFALILPYDVGTGVWTGISGMSFHGGFIGASLGLFFFARRNKISFWKIADFIALSIPFALFSGRLGNFLNGELYGRVTDVGWGMLFFDGSQILLRHPSALYEAFFEGIVLFLCLIFLSRRFRFAGALSASFILLYALIRFWLEFLREPDTGVALFLDVLTRGQILSIIMFFVGVGIFTWLKRLNYAKIPLKV